MKFAVLLSLCGSLTMAQEVRQVLKSDGESAPVRKRLPDGRYLVPGGSRIPLTVLNSVSSKNSQPGDQIYLQTLVPIAIENKIVIPAGSYVTGTITDSKRPGKVKGRGEIGMRFDSMLLASGTTLNLTGRISSLDGHSARPAPLRLRRPGTRQQGHAGRRHRQSSDTVGARRRDTLESEGWRRARRMR